MTNESDLRAAVAVGVIGSGDAYRELLGAIVEVARSIFGARASSILLHDEDTDELVFEAVVGEGEGELLGMRFPAGHGIAGWVLATHTPLIIEDVREDPRFATDVAEGTGYVPSGLMAAPLLHDEQSLGVLEVLDRPGASLFSLQEMELLGLFAHQASIAVDLLQKARKASRLLDADSGELQVVARLAAAVDKLEDERREAGLRLLRELADTLGELTQGLVPVHPAVTVTSCLVGPQRRPGRHTLARASNLISRSRYSATGPSATGPSATGPSATGP